MGNTDKALLLLNWKHIILYSLGTFQNSPDIDEIILVVRPDKIDEIRKLVNENNFTKVAHVTAWGETRQDSVYNGLVLASDSDIVLVHDVARPFASDQMISDVVKNVKEFWWAIPCIGIVDTIKQWDSFVEATLDRSKLHRVQTPQWFQYELLKKAYDTAQSDGFIGTDDASLVEHIWGKVALVAWSAKALKITYPEDLLLIENMLSTEPPHIVEVNSYVKLNLHFDIVWTLENGYHEIDSLFQAVDLFDTLTLRKESSGFYITGCIICETDKNLISKAKRLLEEYVGKSLHCSINLVKACPISAGLGGGSSNAAAAIVGLNTLFQLWLSTEELCEIGVKTGADVPYFIANNPTAQIGWIGEKITPSPVKPSAYYVLARPHKRVSTALIYGEYDRTWKTFYEIVSEICPDVKNLCEYFKTVAEVSGMSGSWPTCFAGFDTCEEAQNAIIGFVNTLEVRPSYEGIDRFNGDLFICQPIESTYRLRIVE